MFATGRRIEAFQGAGRTDAAALAERAASLAARPAVLALPLSCAHAPAHRLARRRSSTTGGTAPGDMLSRPPLGLPCDPASTGRESMARASWVEVIFDPPTADSSHPFPAPALAFAVRSNAS